MKLKRIWRLLKIILLIICVGTMGFCIYKIISFNSEIKEAEVVQKELIDVSNILTEEPEESIINFNDLKNINQDIVAWIYIEGTSINYPIVQTSDNQYYLKHNYNKEYSAYG